MTFEFCKKVVRSVTDASGVLLLISSVMLFAMSEHYRGVLGSSQPLSFHAAAAMEAYIVCGGLLLFGAALIVFPLAYRRAFQVGGRVPDDAQAELS